MPQVTPIDQAYQVFMQLPNLEQMQRVDETIALIPVFSDYYFNTSNYPAYLKAAIHSRQTFINNTDALATRIPIKLYIEAATLPEATPILEANHMNEDDIITFEAPPLPNTFNGIWTQYGKKTRLFCDPQLAHYDQVFFWDADTFKLKQSSSSDIFNRLTGYDKPAFIRAKTESRRDWRPYIIRQTTKYLQYSMISTQTVFENAGLGRTLQAIKDYLTRPLNCFGVYPAKQMHAEHKDLMRWIYDHGPYIGNDEFTFALGAALHGVTLKSLHTEGYTLVNTTDYFQGDTEHTFIHGKYPNSAEGRDLLINL